MGENLRVIVRVVSLTLALARSAASGAACTILCAGAVGWAGLALAQEEATVAQRPAANSNQISFQMRAVTADLSNTDAQRINADADQDNWLDDGITTVRERMTVIGSMRRLSV